MERLDMRQRRYGIWELGFGLGKIRWSSGMEGECRAFFWNEMSRIDEMKGKRRHFFLIWVHSSMIRNGWHGLFVVRDAKSYRCVVTLSAARIVLTYK